MSQLQFLSVASLMFVDHYPSFVPIPRLALLEILPEKIGSGWDSTRILTEAEIDLAKLNWILYSHEVRLRDLSIFTRKALSSGINETHIRILRIEQCRWDATAYVDIIPQIGGSIKELVVTGFGSLLVKTDGWENGEGANDSGWGYNAGAPDEQHSHTETKLVAALGIGMSNRTKKVADIAARTDAMRSAIYTLARHVQSFSLEYSHEADDLACLDPSLLPGNIKNCEVTFSRLMGSKNPYVFPRSTLNLIIKTVKLDGSLLQFIESLQKPDYLLKLESCPEIWIREDSSRPESLAPVFPTVDSDRWVQARATAAVRLTDRGLRPEETPLKMKATSKDEAEWTLGHPEYLNFWASRFGWRRKRGAR